MPPWIPSPVKLIHDCIVPQSLIWERPLARPWCRLHGIFTLCSSWNRWLSEVKVISVEVIFLWHCPSQLFRGSLPDSPRAPTSQVGSVLSCLSADPKRKAYVEKSSWGVKAQVKQCFPSIVNLVIENLPQSIKRGGINRPISRWVWTFPSHFPDFLALGTGPGNLVSGLVSTILANLLILVLKSCYLCYWKFPILLDFCFS